MFITEVCAHKDSLRDECCGELQLESNEYANRSVFL